MPHKTNRFRRSSGLRSYRKLIVIATEGAKTEQQYFAMFNNQHSVIQVKCLRSGHKSSPHQVLKRMEDYLREESLRSTDEAWLVVDRDQWTDEQLNELCTWAERHRNYDIAISNPSFEYWLLLHFEDGHHIVSSEECCARLRRHLPTYDKGIEQRIFTEDRIKNAIRRGKMRDNPPCAGWPRDLGTTTVYRLIGKILNLDEVN